MRGRFSPKGLTEVVEMQQRGVGSTVDLRSDTVTRPTPEMRRAMMAAEVGDDVYGEDPTVNRLETRAAAIMGKEAALFVPTGTMGNQIAVHGHTHPGQEIVCEADTHLYNLELAMTAAFSGCQMRAVSAPDGHLSWERIAPALRQGARDHRAQTGLVVIENTHNWAGGVALPPAETGEICHELRRRGIANHLDGARIFNAAIALGCEAHELAAPFDTVMFCLSKGLGAPVGSLLAGPADFIKDARATRRMLGGGMRQAGVLAAAGLVALETGPQRLARDHDHARMLAEALGQIPGVQVTPPVTNIVVFTLSSMELTAGAAVAKLAERNVLASTLDERRIRLVTHGDLDRAGCEEAIFALQSVLARY